ncbi:TetR/AcrR family transcriptional regulator [Methylobacterium phyllosphaerae]
MGRTAGSNGPRTAAAIRQAGLRLIYRHGYEAMTLRALAAEVGIQAASLYNHIRSKQDLLFDIIRDHMETLLVQTDAALATAADEPASRLRAFVAHHVTYHLEKKQDVFIANFELRSLDAKHYTAIVAMRRAYEDRLVTLLDLGVAAGDFEIRDTRVAGYAILGMLTSACTWYRLEGRMTKTEVVDLHTDLALHGCLRRQR